MENVKVEDFYINHTVGNRTYRTLASGYVTANLLWEIWVPCIWVIGCVGNTSTVVMMLRLKSHHSCYQHTAFLALAVSDTLVLLSGSIRQWLRYAKEVDIRNLHAVICGLHKWVINSSSSTSAWLLTCVAVQRVTAIIHLLAVRHIWTVRRTWLVIAALNLTAYTWHFHLVVGHELSSDKRCKPYPGGYRSFYNNVYPWVDLFMSSLCPSAIQFICNIIMSWKLWSGSRKAMVTADLGETNTLSAFYVRRKVASRTTLTVLALSTSFLLMSLPVYLFYAVWYTNQDYFFRQPVQELARLQLVSTVTHLLWYTNCSINFYLYCLTGPGYRRECWACVRGLSNLRSQPSVKLTRPSFSSSST